VPIVKGGVYQHYKGHNYKVLDIVKHSETLEDLVLYECLYDNDLGKTWVRPLEMFLETIVIDGVERARFEYVGNKKGNSRL
jgi:hypothetical protein